MFDDTDDGTFDEEITPDTDDGFFDEETSPETDDGVPVEEASPAIDEGAFEEDAPPAVDEGARDEGTSPAVDEGISGEGASPEPTPPDPPEAGGGAVEGVAIGGAAATGAAARRAPDRRAPDRRAPDRRVPADRDLPDQALPASHARYFWASIVMLALFYLELDWWNRNVYRHDPYLDVLSSANIDKILAWMAGFFFLTVFTSLKAGRFFSTFKIPAALRKKDAYRLLANRWAPAVIVTLVLAVYGLVVARPRVHFRYLGSEKTTPKLLINGQEQRLAGSPPSISRPLTDIFAEETDSKPGPNIVLRDEFHLFSQTLQEEQFLKRLPFVGHRTIDLDPIRPRFSIHYVDRKANLNYMREFSFDRGSDLGKDFLPIEDALRFLATIFREVKDQGGTPGVPDEDNKEGRFPFRGKTYRFEYEEKEDIVVKVFPTELTSLLLLQPREGVQRYFDKAAVPEERQQIILEFQADLEALKDDDERIGAYRDLWNSDKLRKARTGTEYQRARALQLVAEAFRESGRQVPKEEISTYIEEIRKKSLRPRLSGIDESQFAVAAICSLASPSPALQREVLDQLLTFFTELGSGNHKIFPSATENILRMAPNRVPEALAVVKVMWRNSRGSAAQVTQDKIVLIVEEYRDRLPDGELAARSALGRFLANPGDYE